MEPEITRCDVGDVTKTSMNANCSIKYLIENELDDVIVQVTLDPPDVSMKTFPNSREVGTWLELTGLTPGTRYEIITVPIIRSTMGIQYKFLLTTVVNTPVFDAVEFFNATTATGNLTINGSYDEISLSLNLEQLEDEMKFTAESGLLQWVFHSLIPGAQYKLIAKAVAGPWSREAEYFLNVEPSKPVVFNETLLPIGFPLSDNSSVNYTFYIEGRGQAVEYNVKCAQNNETTDSLEMLFKTLVSIEFPRYQIGCKLLMRVLSFEHSPFYEYSIYIGYLENVVWARHSNNGWRFGVNYNLVGRADSLKLEVTPPILQPMNCLPTKTFCDTAGFYEGQIFHFSLTPIVGDSRGESEHFELLVPIRINKNIEYIKTANRSETRLGIKLKYVGLVLSWRFDFEPGDAFDFDVGKSSHQMN